MTRRSGPDPLSLADEDVETDALSALGHETRIRILRALADADAPLSFTELREAVDVRDTGKFNYHLTKLCEYFVRETPEGYELGHAGNRVIQAGRAGSREESPSPVVECPICGDSDCEKLFHIHLGSASGRGP